jgi:hypothetical protein
MYCYPEEVPYSFGSATVVVSDSVCRGYTRDYRSTLNVELLSSRTKKSTFKLEASHPPC